MESCRKPCRVGTVPQSLVRPTGPREGFPDDETPRVLGTGGRGPRSRGVKPSTQGGVRSEEGRTPPSGPQGHVPRDGPVCDHESHGEGGEEGSGSTRGEGHPTTQDHPLVRPSWVPGVETPKATDITRHELRRGRCPGGRCPGTVSGPVSQVPRSGPPSSRVSRRTRRARSGGARRRHDPRRPAPDGRTGPDPLSFLPSLTLPPRGRPRGSGMPSGRDGGNPYVGHLRPRRRTRACQDRVTHSGSGSESPTM